MTRDDRPTDPPDGDDPRDEDPDRAAILARRRRFIAIALSGLTVGATGCPEPAQPATPPDSGTAPGDARPEPCLKVAAPPESTPTDPPPPKDPEPTPCLKVAAPPEPEPAPEPTPCLKVAPPPPKEPEPQPCLSVRPRSDDEAKPQPCLKVARPKSG